MSATPAAMQRLMLPGAEEYDYSLALTDSEPADGKVEIAAKLGADVAKVKYAFFEGGLRRRHRQGQFGGHRRGNGRVEGDHGGRNHRGPIRRDRQITVVANIYDEAGELQGYEFLSFGYVKAGDDKPVERPYGAYVGVRSAGTHSENSIRSIIFGENIESGYMGLFKECRPDR